MYASKGDKPDFTFQRDNSRQKDTVWGGMGANGILLRSYFFEGNVDGGNYLEIINIFTYEHFHKQVDMWYVPRFVVDTRWISSA